MAASMSSPPEHRIPVRKMAFDYSQISSKYWYRDNPLITTMFAAMSATFPPGEGSFIASVRHYREQISDPELQQQVRSFIGQEGHHSHQHKAVNRRFDRSGLQVTRLEKHLEQDVAKISKVLSPEFHLASTVGMEHITAIFAEHALTSERFLADMPEPIRSLIIWHSIEEIEHKSVAYDVFMSCVGERKLLRRAMFFSSFDFFVRVLCYQIALLYWDRCMPSWGHVKGYLSFLFGCDGMVRRTFKAYMRYFKRDFSPWQHDNRALVQHWQKQLEHYHLEGH